MSEYWDNPNVVLGNPYRNSTLILVTGGAGYIGSHMCVALAQAGLPHVILDNFSNSRRSVLDGMARITGQQPECVEGDVRDSALVRDVLARVVVGGKVSLTVGSLSVLGAVVLGVFLGLVAGYYGSFWETFLMRCVDVQMALPFILIAITFIAIVGGSVRNLIIFMILAQWVQYARLVRAQVIELREREFIQAARSFGVGAWAQIRHHFLPNLMGPVVILMALNVGNNILLESSLTFLGLGVDPTIPSWGGMLADGRTYMQTAWWVSVFPGLAIMMTVLGLNLLADGLREESLKD